MTILAAFAAGFVSARLIARLKRKVADALVLPDGSACVPAVAYQIW